MTPSELARMILQSGSRMKTPGMEEQKHQYGLDDAPDVYRRPELRNVEEFLKGPGPRATPAEKAEHAAVMADLRAVLGGSPAGTDDAIASISVAVKRKSGRIDQVGSVVV